MQTYAIFIVLIIFGTQILNVGKVKEQNSITYSTVSSNSEYFSQVTNFQWKSNYTEFFNNSHSISGANTTIKPDLLMKLFIPVSSEIPSNENIDNETLNVLSIITFKNISNDIHSIERTMNRTLNQDEYVAIKEKYFSKTYYRKIYCLPDLGDILDEPNIQSIGDEACNAPLITLNYGGRMGNQIAQYLSLFILHTLYNASIAMYPEMDAFLMLMFENRSIPIIPVFCENEYKRKKTSFNFIHTYLAIERLFSIKFNETYDYQSAFDEPVIVILSNPCPVHLFMKRRKMVKNELRIKSSLVQSARIKLRQQTPPRITDAILISIHVRRTDYQLLAQQHSHELLSMNYYDRAMDFFRSTSRFRKAVFMVFSDDLAWCRKHFIGKDIVVAGDGNEVDPFMDFAMMSECDHHIVGYGTFSVTAALLGNGLIVYPLATVPRERVFGIQTGCLCSNSSDLIPIPDIPLIL